MVLLVHLIIGFLMAYLGLIPPGMLNMTTVRTTITQGQKAGIQFAAGASIITAVHSFIAFTFAEFLTENPHIIDNLRYLGVIVLFGLSVFFFYQARKEFTGEGKKNVRHPFQAGFMMSVFNMLGIPFYFGTSAVLANQGKITLLYPQIIFLIIGATLGAFALFATYALFAEFISRKVGFIARNINYILSAIFLVLAVALIINIVS